MSLNISPCHIVARFSDWTLFIIYKEAKIEKDYSERENGANFYFAATETKVVSTKIMSDFEIANILATDSY